MSDKHYPQSLRKIIENKSDFKNFRWWRATTVFMIVLFVITLGVYITNIRNLNQIAKYEHIAEIEITGFVSYDRKLIEILEKIEKNDQVKALIVRIDTSGGGVVGAEVIFNKIKSIAQKKPVVANIGTVAASAGYLIASAANKIYAHETSIVGSIGVIIQWAEIQKLLGNLGIETKVIRSGPFKALPNPFEKTPPYVRENLQNAVQEIHHWFVDIIVQQRKINKQKLLKIADGRIFSGIKALENKLIDEIGDKQKTLEWLKEYKNLDEEIETILYKTDNLSERLGLSGANSNIVFKIFNLFQEIVTDLNDDKNHHIINGGALLKWQPGK